jgi:malate/lactate dehydrogenase
MIGAAATTTKVAVVGAGSVGATPAYACLVRGIGRTIALYDLEAAKTRAEVLDLSHGLQFVPQATVVGSDDIEVCRGADPVVVTAGAKQKPGQAHLELANVALCRTLVPQLLEGVAGISEVCLSLPSVVDRGGVEAVLPGPLPEEEVEGLRRSGDTVRGVIRSLGL